MKKIPLTQGKYALVDDEDYDSLVKYKWCAVKRGKKYYAGRRHGNKFVYLHQELLGKYPGLEIDHINGNSLDNWRSNLRLVTHRQNMQNRWHRRYSKYPGVSWDKTNKKWIAWIWIGGKHRFLGRYDEEEQAFLAYCLALKRLGFNLPDLAHKVLD